MSWCSYREPDRAPSLGLTFLHRAVVVRIGQQLIVVCWGKR